MEQIDTVWNRPFWTSKLCRPAITWVKELTTLYKLCLQVMTVCGIPINEEYGTLALTVRSFNSAAETAHTVTAAWIHCSRLQKDNKSIVQPPISAQERSWMTDKWLICLYLRREQWKFKGTIDCPKTIAGIASALFLFIVIIGIIVCCFLCSCCYLYRRRHQLREQFAGPREVVHSYPMHPAYPSNVSPGMQAPYPTAPAYGAAGSASGFQSYPLNPVYPPNIPPGSYPPYQTAPAYSATTAPPQS
ncbi:protein shisa-4 isoform X4 [Hypanus sabinus]|uniref:protein shisa-4 isoform X4 n=1 Tax=Hypanus sabinus TaxID=79690 RepID=UPI0028C3DF58|nr:protein shisa-4 isoform X4 [Hypanus sabinus]